MLNVKMMLATCLLKCSSSRLHWQWKIDDNIVLRMHYAMLCPQVRRNQAFLH